MEFDLNKPDKNPPAINDLICGVITEHSGDAIIVLNADLTVETWNHAAVAMFEYDENEILGSSLLHIACESDRPDLQSILHRSLKNRIPLTTEHKCLAKTGIPIDAEFKIIPLDPTGKHYEKLVLIVADITEQKNSARGVRTTEQKFKALVEATTQIVWTANPDGSPDEDSPSWRAFTGQTEEEWKHSVRDKLHPDETEMIRHQFEDCIEKKKVFETELRIRHYSGEWRWMQTKAVPILDKNGLIRSWIGMSTDITKKKRAELKLEQTSSQLRELTARTNLEVENERKRIATEVHDQLGGNLAVIKHDLKRIADKISEQLNSAFNREMGNDIFVTSDLLEKVIGITKTISSELYSSELEFLGLISALKSEANSFEKRHEIKHTFESNILDSSLGREQESAVYWVFRELLRNILRHSQAAEISINVNETNEWFVLTVKDNGRGITEAEINSSESLGILGMRERVKKVGGHFNLQGLKKLGTVAIITFYLNKSVDL
jgi:PAS domain S-box-containing protein